jgi:hypothetical protein
LLGPLNNKMRLAAERSIRQSIKGKLINVPSAAVALDLGYGLAAVMIRRALQGGIDLRELDAAGLLLLRAFGVKEIEARRISRLPLAALPEIRLRTAVIDGFGAA